MAIISGALDLLLCVSAQLIISSVVLGFTSPTSSIRHVVTPALIACSWSFVLHAKYVLPQPWAAIASSILCCLLLSYISIAFLSARSFDTRDSASQPAKVKAKAETPSGGARDSRAKEEEEKGTALERLIWGFQSLLSFRDIGTPYEAKNVPYFLPDDPSYVPSKPAFILRSAVTLAISYLVIDFVENQPPPPNAAQIFSAAAVPIKGRLGEISIEEAITRIAASAGYWITLSSSILAVSSAINIVCVVLGLSSVESCRPLLGSPSDAYTVRGFWGKTWHQGTRKIFAAPANFIGDDLFVFRKGSPPNTYSKVFVTFFISGLLHQVADFSNGMLWNQSGSLKFFCVQAGGILVEDTVQLIYRLLSGAKYEDPPRLWTRLVGYVWMVFFMLFWTTPWWVYPIVERNLEFQSSKVIPRGFSVFDSLLKK